MVLPPQGGDEPRGFRLSEVERQRRRWAREVWLDSLRFCQVHAKSALVPAERKAIYCVNSASFTACKGVRVPGTDLGTGIVYDSAIGHPPMIEAMTAKVFPWS